MKPTERRFAFELILCVATAILIFSISKLVTGPTDYFRYAYAGLILVGGVLVARDIARIKRSNGAGKAGLAGAP